MWFQDFTEYHLELNMYCVFLQGGGKKKPFERMKLWLFRSSYQSKLDCERQKCHERKT